MDYASLGLEGVLLVSRRTDSCTQLRMAQSVPQCKNPPPHQSGRDRSHRTGRRPDEYRSGFGHNAENSQADVERIKNAVEQPDAGRHLYRTVLHYNPDMVLPDLVSRLSQPGETYVDRASRSHGR